MPDRPDPVTDRLARFTPAAGGLDRDAVLFAAGRQSARGSRLWPAVAGLLAVSHLVTVFALWPRSPDAPAPVPAMPPEYQAPDFVLPPASPPGDVWSAGSPPEVIEMSPAPPAGEYVPSGPTLTVRSGLRLD